MTTANELHVPVSVYRDRPANVYEADVRRCDLMKLLGASARWQDRPVAKSRERNVDRSATAGASLRRTVRAVLRRRAREDAAARIRGCAPEQFQKWIRKPAEDAARSELATQLLENATRCVAEAAMRMRRRFRRSQGSTSLSTRLASVVTRLQGQCRDRAVRARPNALDEPYNDCGGRRPEYARAVVA